MYSAEVLGTVHTELYVSQNELLDAVEKLPALCDEPFGDSSILPTYLVSALAKSKVTVSLSGDGGDELFWGYTRYQRTLKLWQQVERVPTPLRRLLAESATNPTIQNLTRHLRVPGFVSKAGRLNLKLQRAAGIYGALSHAALYHQYISTWPFPNTLVNGEGHSTAYNTPQHWSASLPAEQRMATQDLLHYLPDDILLRLIEPAWQ